MNANYQKYQTVQNILKKHEKEKKGVYNYNNTIMNMEHETFTPLVFSLTGGKGPETFINIQRKNIMRKLKRSLSLNKCKLFFDIEICSDLS